MIASVQNSCHQHRTESCLHGHALTGTTSLTGATGFTGTRYTGATGLTGVSVTGRAVRACIPTYAGPITPLHLERAHADT